MNILVTGGAGFIGSNLADRLIDEGHRVIVVDNLSTGNKKYVNPKAKFYKLDIQDKKIGDIIRKEKIEIVSHHAAQIDVRYSVASPVNDAKVNILGSVNIMESALGTDVKKVIFSSTGGAIYGEQETFPAAEIHPTNPLCPYGIAKLAFEKYLFYYKAVYGMDYIVLRYANVYGPRQNSRGEAGVVAIFADKMLGGENPVINGDGKQTRDYTYVGDIVAANMAVLRSKGSDIYNVGTGIESDVNTIWREIRKLTGFAGEENHGPAKKGEQLRSVLDSSKLTKGTGWQPEYKLDAGLKKTIEWFKNN